VDTLPRSADRSEVTLCSDRENLVAAATQPRASLGGGIIVGVTVRSAVRDRARPPVSQDAARQTLANAADQLLAEARAACLRDAVPASKQELVSRIAVRIGLSEAEVGQSLRLNRPPPCRASHPPVDDPMIAVAAAILGRREHTVFLARRTAPPNDARTVHALATQLGVSIERIYQLEASALHKLTTALR